MDMSYQLGRRHGSEDAASVLSRGLKIIMLYCEGICYLQGTDFRGVRC